ncbi:XF1762 family protein [Actinokineospora enzanensis]|uniref:XF1762 family protein n=1 Tax=Actinokineospora enzanensis TaxID=155975 RepID=UPI000363F576|nr:XF1762 family protein [Actinokineospora enzanensis]
MSALAPVRLRIVPVSFREVTAFIAAHHRHHRPPRGMKFAIGVERVGQLVGVATVGRPVARLLDDNSTVEVTRTCTLGHHGANSKLYGACWRAARAMGYHRLITYTQHGETGASLRAAGLIAVAELRPRSGWSTPGRPRQDRGVDGIARVRWEIRAGDADVAA